MGDEFTPDAVDLPRCEPEAARLFFVANPIGWVKTAYSGGIVHPYKPSLLIILYALGVGASPAAHAQDSAPAQTPLNLSCEGSVTQSDTDSSSAQVRASNGTMASATIDQSTSTSHGGSIDVLLFGGDDRIRLPQGFRPRLFANGDDWVKIKNLKTSDREINGNAEIGFMDTPSFRIDRVSGRIELSGIHGIFYGQCHKVEPEKEKPQF